MFENIKRLWRSLICSEASYDSDLDEVVSLDAAQPAVTGKSPQPFNWRGENVLFLGTQAGLLNLGRALSGVGASVAFRSLRRLQDIYLLPLEQYTMVILPSDSDGLAFDITDIGGILRRADQVSVLVWTIEDFILSHSADEEMRGVDDIVLSLPATAKDLELLLCAKRSSGPRVEQDQFV